MESTPQSEHVVFFPAPDGTPAFRRVPSLEEAVRLVEHLRNVDGVHEVGVHRLSEVPLAFKPYYRVEMPSESAAAPAPEPVEAVEAVEVALEAPVDVPVALVPVVDDLDRSLADLLGTPPEPEASEPGVPTLTVVELAPEPEPALEPDRVPAQAEPVAEEVHEEPLAAAGSTVLPAEGHHRPRGLGFFSS